MESSFRLFSVRGIRIGANWSWLFVFALITWSLAAAQFPRTYPNLTQTAYVAMAVVTAVLFVASLLLHELGHALRALREGMEIEGITLWLFGGVARFKGMFPSAGAEFRIAIAGPVVSAVLAALFGVLTVLLNHTSAPVHVVGVTDYIARLNLTLLLFNMVPALPLDGGRVLRSYLWYRQRDFAAATLRAARVARVLAGVLIAFGLLTALQGAGYGGLWLSFIGWFLLQAAQGEAAYALARSGLGGLRVRDVMSPDPEVASPDQSLSEFFDEFGHARAHSNFPVVGPWGLDGLVSLRAAGAVPPDRRAQTSVRDVMLPRDEVPVVAPGDDLVDVVPLLQRPPGRAVVVENGRVAGILSGSDVGRAIEIGRMREPAAPQAPRRRRTPAAFWIIGSIVALAAAGIVWKPPLAVLAPGDSFDVTKDIHVSGVPTDDVRGKYLLTSVAVDQPTGLGLVWSLIRSREVVPISALIPRNTDPKTFFEEQKKMFEQSRMLAAAAAARAAGLHVDVSSGGARVVDVVPGAPASRVLRKDDLITAIDGDDVALAEDVGARLKSQPAGTGFTLTIERDGRQMTVRVRSRAGVVQEGPGIGVYTETHNLSVKLPFTVTFSARDIGGTSAGLAYALATYDLLTKGDLAHGRLIAATGTIDVDGRVGPIGGVREKAAAARTAGAQLFLVPDEELSGAHGTGLSTYGVGTLQDALRTLKRAS